MDTPREQVFKIHGKGKVVRTEWVNFTNSVDDPINLAEKSWEFRCTLSIALFLFQGDI